MNLIDLKASTVALPNKFKVHAATGHARIEMGRYAIHKQQRFQVKNRNVTFSKMVCYSRSRLTALRMNTQIIDIN